MEHQMTPAIRDRIDRIIAVLIEAESDEEGLAILMTVVGTFYSGMPDTDQQQFKVNVTKFLEDIDNLPTTTSVQ